MKSDPPSDAPAAPAADVSTAERSETENVERLRRLAREYGLEFLSSVPAEILDADLVSGLSVDWARSNCLLPVSIKGEACVLTADPAGVSQQEYLSLLLGRELRPVVAARSVILHGIEQCYYSKDDSPGDFLRGLEGRERTDAAPRSRSDDLLRVAEQAPVTQLVNLILLEAVKRRASDIHFEPFESQLRVRYRIDGVLYEQTSPPKNMEEALVSRLKVMARMDIAEKRLPQDGMAKVRVGEREIDIRVSTVPAAEGERVVLRLLDRDSVLLPLERLGMSDTILPRFRATLAEPNGIVVVSGPTGSGKTTTLYAALAELDASRKNILTIEDPIEYQLPAIGQIQVKPKIGLTFANGLRHILRQDPDIILVGETRDTETAEIALRAALTGHLVFTTLHTNDAPGAVLRMMDMGVEKYLLASCLKGILAQRLVRRLCLECRREIVLGPEQAGELGSRGSRLEGRKAWEPVGCPRCLEGYSGRVGLFEFMTVAPEVQSLIRAGDFDAQRFRDVRGAGFATLVDDGADKVAEGVTSLAEVITVAA
jgi:general secretion pathway protein E